MALLAFHSKSSCVTRSRLTFDLTRCSLIWEALNGGNPFRLPMTNPFHSHCSVQIYPSYLLECRDSCQKPNYIYCSFAVNRPQPRSSLSRYSMRTISGYHPTAYLSPRTSAPPSIMSKDRSYSTIVGVHGLPHSRSRTTLWPFAWS